MTFERVRVGIIGAGWWAAHTHAPALKAIDGVEIVAACRRSPERLIEFAAKVGIPQTYTDHEAMLDQADLDAVVVCSPHGLHYAHVKAALERGLPVLTDKPLAIRSAEAEELADLAEQKGVLLAVFFGHAYDARCRYAAGQIRAGALGRLAHADVTAYANADSLGFFGNESFPEASPEFEVLPTDFRSDAGLGGGGYLQDVGSHAVSALMIGTGLRVASVGAVMNDPDIDLRASVSLRFTNGAQGTVTVCGDMRPPNQPEGRYWGFGRWQWTGDQGTLWQDGVSSGLHVQRWGEAAQTVAESDLPAYENPDANFIAALRGQSELIAPAREAVECVRVIGAAYESARTGRLVTLQASAT